MGMAVATFFRALTSKWPTFFDMHPFHAGMSLIEGGDAGLSFGSNLAQNGHILKNLSIFEVSTVKYLSFAWNHKLDKIRPII